jgi:hypothetical protein
VKWSRYTPFAVALGLLTFGLAGCGGSDGPKYVKVSGVVTLNGKPYPNAVVVFAPQGTKENTNPGKSSSGYTDANGRFELKIQNEDTEGAAVGSHLVRIMTKGSDITIIDPTVGSPDSGGKARKPDPIPSDWSATSKHTFTVPPEGTDQANFDIVSKKR